MSYTIINKQVLFKLEDKIILLRNMYDNNVWPHDKDIYNFLVFKNEAEYLAWAGNYKSTNDNIAKIGGKFIGSFDYYKKLLRLLRNPSNINNFNIYIRQWLGFKNEEHNLYYDIDQFYELNRNQELRDDFLNKYGNISFKRIKKDLKLKDLDNELAHVEINMYKIKYPELI